MTELTREIETDVLVVGGGTAGFAAALAAARAGLRVRLVEAGSKVGGVMASCPGMPWGGGYPLGHSIGGIFGELNDRLSAMSPPCAEVRPCTLENFGPEVQYDHEAATLLMFDMLDEAGATLYLNTFAGEPEMDGNRISAVSAHDRLGPLRFHPRMVIDCSGDGDLSARAGVPHTLGDGKGNMMAVSLTFHMVGADTDAVFAEDDPYFRRFAARGIAEGRLHPDLHKLYLMRGFHPGSVFCNTVTIRGVDGTDPESVTRATQEGRRRCHQVARFLVEEVPGFQNAQLWGLGPSVGVRETRRLQAIYRIRGDDIARAVKFDDGIAACDNPIDDVMRASAEMTHEAAVRQGEYYTIPFRALVPETIENLLFAGRLICADPVAFASVRGMPQCMAMGQATGVAAAMVLEGALRVQNVNGEILAGVLMQQGMAGIAGRTLGAVE